MKNIPQMPSIKPSSDVVRSDSPFTEGAEQSAPDVSLNPPVHSGVAPEVIPGPEFFKKPELLDVNSSSNTIKKVVVPAQGIAVVATRAGFYNQTRYSIHDELFVQSEDDLGDWMSCVDPVFEKVRLNIIKEKKARH